MQNNGTNQLVETSRASWYPYLWPIVHVHKNPKNEARTLTMASCCTVNKNEIKYHHKLANNSWIKDMSIKHANYVRIMIYEFKKTWKSWDSYSAFLDVMRLASDWNRILGCPANEWCAWNGLRKPGTRKSDCNFSLKF